MKGVGIIKADVSNAIDVYALLKQAVKENVFPVGKPNDRQLKDYYFRLISEQLPSSYHRFYLARRGRGYLGLLHAMLIPGPWDGNVDTAHINLLFVTKNRRKKGIGGKLLKAFKEDIQDLPIKNIDLLGEDHVVKYWKKQGAKPVTNYMRIENG